MFISIIDYAIQIRIAREKVRRYRVNKDWSKISSSSLNPFLWWMSFRIPFIFNPTRTMRRYNRRTTCTYLNLGGLEAGDGRDLLSSSKHCVNWLYAKVCVNGEFRKLFENLREWIRFFFCFFKIFLPLCVTLLHPQKSDHLLSRRKDFLPSERGRQNKRKKRNKKRTARSLVFVTRHNTRRDNCITNDLEVEFRGRELVH